MQILKFGVGDLFSVLDDSIWEVTSECVAYSRGIFDDRYAPGSLDGEDVCF